jgi:hypothetical protein
MRSNFPVAVARAGMTQCLVADSPFSKANAGRVHSRTRSAAFLGILESVGKGKTGGKSWITAHTEVIIGSTDRWCGQNQIHLENVG